MSEQVFTVEEVALYLKIDVQGVRRLLRLGQLRGFKVGREWRVSSAALREFEQQGGTAKTETDTK